MSYDRNFELMSDTDLRDEGVNEQMAERMAYDLLCAWRSRLDPEGWAEDRQLARTYPLEGGGQVELDSATATAVKVTHTSEESGVKVYEFGFSDGRGSLTAHGVSEDTDPLGVYDDFSRLLFDCDRIEMGDI